MYNALTIEHCLYVIDNHIFKLFLAEANHNPLEGYVSSAISLNPVNNFAVVLQIWCLVNEDDLGLGIDHHKIIPYSIDYYILNLLRPNKKIRLFLTLHKASQKAKYILAYHLACATLQWGDAIISKHQQGQNLCQTNQSRDYFVYVKNEKLDDVPNDPFYQFQKTIIHLLAKDYSKSNHLETLIDEALLQTRRYLHKVKQ